MSPRPLIWIAIRILALAALIGFLIVGSLFALSPESFTGGPITSESALWHSLTLAFMATVTLLAAMVLYNPKRYWHALLPIAVGKATSSISSLYWHTKFNTQFLYTNTIVDGGIAAISIILFLYLLYIRAS